MSASGEEIGVLQQMKILFFIFWDIMSTWSSPSGLVTRAVKELPSVSLVTRSTWVNTLMIIVTLSTLEKLLKMIIDDGNSGGDGV